MDQLQFKPFGFSVSSVSIQQLLDYINLYPAHSCPLLNHCDLRLKIVKLFSQALVLKHLDYVI